MAASTTVTSKTGRRTLGSLPGNSRFSGGDLDAESREIARKASFNALVGHANTPASSTPLRKHSLATDMDRDQDADLVIGDVVGVPGGMTGTVKFVGSVEGKKGIFAGVELSQEYASRGKNDGDVDGVQYFNTSVPGAGIFLPSHRAIKQYSPSPSTSIFPPTPSTPASVNDRRNGAPSTRSPPTPSISKFSQSVGPGTKHPLSQSVGPGVRPSSPMQKLKPKPRQSLPRPESPFRKQPTLQPTPARSVGRGMRPSGSSPPGVGPAKSRTPIPASRSPSRNDSRQGHLDYSPDVEHTPTSMRPRASIRNLSDGRAGVSGASEEIKKMRKQLEDRDKQLAEQNAALREMESNLVEFQTLMAAEMAKNNAPEPGTEEAGVAELRSMLRAKQDKIDVMQKEFDSHRADFRNTIDALETAATETERIYEQQKEDLSKENEELRRSQEDVATINEQFKNFEYIVQDLEENVELARRGEAEAKGEAEFLHGEVERLRLELRREREKMAKTARGSIGSNSDTGLPSPPLSDNSKEIERRDDEIRGLKAIIHKLNLELGAAGPADRDAQGGPAQESSAALREQLVSLAQEKKDLQSLIERTRFHEEDLERENARLRAAAGQNPFGNHGKTDSSSTATTMHTAQRHSTTSNVTAIRPTSGGKKFSDEGGPLARTSSGSMSKVKTAPSEAATEASGTADGETLWCELCAEAGHDILTCSSIPSFKDAPSSPIKEVAPDEDTIRDIITPRPLNGGRHLDGAHDAKSARSSTDKTLVEQHAPPMLTVGDGPVAGKSSGVVDMALWCALCEHEGHASIDCPIDDF